MNDPRLTRRAGQWLLALAAALAAALPAATVAGDDLPSLVRQAQTKVVKVYGAGGFQGLEAYQSGVLASADGHILTAFSYVLDTSDVRVVIDDGRRFEAKLLGADPYLEVAVLKIDAGGLPAFDLAAAEPLATGERVLAVSNAFGVATGNEPASVQHGTVAVSTRLESHGDAAATRYRGPILVLDVVTNNPGAAGGAIVDRRGRLAGMIGKEVRNPLNDTWLNYAIPTAEVRKSVDEIRAGKFVARDAAPDRKRPERPATLALLGIALVPDVVDRTPPYVDRVVRGSAAERAGLQADDLVLLVGERLVQSCKNLQTELSFIDHEDPVRLTVLREGKLVELSLVYRNGEPR